MVQDAIPWPAVRSCRSGFGPLAPIQAALSRSGSLAGVLCIVEAQKNFERDGVVPNQRLRSLQLSSAAHQISQIAFDLPNDILGYILRGGKRMVSKQGWKARLCPKGERKLFVYDLVCLVIDFNQDLS